MQLIFFGKVKGGISHAVFDELCKKIWEAL
jgi:hypothetical protein